MTPRALAALRILALVAAYRERFGEQAAAALLLDLRRQLRADRRPNACQLCGEPLVKRRRGRPRKYCPGCVAQLGHRTIAEQLRKNGAENV